MRLIKNFMVLISTLICASVFGQADTTVQQITQPDYGSKSSGLKLKPRLGLGIGTLVFYGDIGGDDAGYHAGSADMAYTLDVTNEITSYLDVRLYTVFGRIHINELTNPRRLNLQSEVRSGGVMLSYNFDHFLPSARSAEPFICAGFESFEFLSKTDLYDANGMRYHYWSDGTIRNIDENAGNADESILLQRDYVYETDLRELNSDGFGAYPERSFAIPVGAGVQFKATERVRVRLGATYHFSLTDMVDNINEQSTGVRQGNPRNDRFLFSSFSINYDLNPLNIKKREFNPELYDENGELLASLEDTDKDGIADILDKCQGTPEGVPVDSYGCPLDSDKDGFPDYRDEEPNSAHNYVDAEGIAMYDEDIYDRYLMWHDSIAWKGNDELMENFAQVMSDPSKAKQSYRVRVPRSMDRMTQEDINLLLSFKDVETVGEGEDSYYLVGNFDQLPSALKRKIQLGEQGINSNIVEGSTKEGYSEVTITPELQEEAEAAYFAGLEEDSEFNEEIHYRVQVGAFRYKISMGVFADMGDVMTIKGGDGLTRYVSRSYDSMEEAANRRIELLLMGFDGSFITAYQGGGRITLADAGMSVKDSSKDVVVDEENNSIDPDAVVFRVQLGVFNGNVPTETLDKMLALGNVKPRRESDGNTYFLSQSAATLDEIQAILNQAKELGIQDAQIIGDFNGTMIPLEDAMNIKGLNDHQVYSGE